MTIEHLKELVLPPEKPVGTGNPEGWDKVEQELGLTLPTDYKDFARVYGAGNLAGFIHIFNPFSDSPYSSLLKCVKQICEVYRFLKQHEGDKQVPYAVYPDKPGLLPWGRNDLGHVLFWLTEGNPDSWPIVLSHGKSDRYERFNLGMVDFLARALPHELDSTIWPDDFPDPDTPITFNPQKIAKTTKSKDASAKTKRKSKP